MWTNRNKESLTLDIKDPRGLDVARRLLADADVFIQNLAPGAAARAGSAPSTCSVKIPG